METDSLIVPRLTRGWVGFERVDLVSGEYLEVMWLGKKVGDTLTYYSSSPNDQTEIMLITKIDGDGIWGKELN